MGTLTSFFGGGGGGVYLPHFVLTSNTTWNVDLDGQVCVHVIGGGGSGATYGANQATGGGAGGYSRKIIDVVSGQAYTVVIGAGGAPKTVAGNGSTGGASTFSGHSVSMTANGGEGGYQGGTGASGGTASGGDVNVTGGGSGAISNVGPTYVATGGGAVGIFGTGYSSGTISSTTGQYIATGGAGIGGNSADITVSGNYRTSGGGGSGGPSYYSFNSTSEIATKGGPSLISKPYDIRNIFRFIPEFGAGETILMRGSGSESYSGFSFETAGVGGGGSPTTSSDSAAQALRALGDGGAFAGGAGIVMNANTTYRGTGGFPGGGGGGCAYSSWSGAGGNGAVIIEYLSA